MSKRGENIYKRHDGRWEARILISSGKYKYVYGKSYKEVKEKKKDYWKNNEPKSISKIEKMNDISDLFECWLKDSAFNRVKNSTYESYYLCMHKYIIPYFKYIQENQLTEIQVRQFVSSIYANTTLSETYKKKIISIFRTAVKDILNNSNGSNDYLKIMAALKLRKTESTSVQVFSVSEQRRIENEVLNATDTKVVWLMLCFYTGIRLGELCALKWKNFDFESKCIFIMGTVSRTKNFKGSGSKTLLAENSPKSHNSLRKIPLPDFILQILKTQKKYAKNENNYVLSESPIPMDPRTYQRLFKTVLKNAGVTERKFHAIRHTFATRALESGVDIKTLSEILGHSNVTITLNIYAHSLMEQKISAMEKMNQLHIIHMGLCHSSSII